MKKLFVIGFILFIGFFPICAGADLIDFESAGRGFESLRAYHIIKGFQLFC